MKVCKKKHKFRELSGRWDKWGSVYVTLFCQRCGFTMEITTESQIEIVTPFDLLDETQNPPNDVPFTLTSTK